MNHLKMILGLALIPLYAWLESCVPLATGSRHLLYPRDKQLLTGLLVQKEEEYDHYSHCAT
jgi:hypothetical protein